jgi:hypothetical protein
MFAYSCASRVYVREIGDMDEGVVERRKDSGNSKNHLTLPDLRTERDILLSGTGSFLGRHGDRFRGLSIWLVEIVAKISRNSNVCDVGAAPLSPELSTSAIFLKNINFLLSFHLFFLPSATSTSAKLDAIGGSVILQRVDPVRCDCWSLSSLRGAIATMASKTVPANMDDFVVGIIGMGDMGKMYARRLSDAGWR